MRSWVPGGCWLACLTLGCGRSLQLERLDLGHQAHSGATPASSGDGFFAGCFFGFWLGSNGAATCGHTGAA